MRVTIEHSTGRSLFTKVHRLRCGIEFTELEKAVIKRAGLGEYIFFEAEQPGLSEEVNRHFVKDIVRNSGLSVCYPTEAECRSREAMIREALKTLKEAIESNTEAPKARDTFEL